MGVANSLVGVVNVGGGVAIAKGTGGAVCRRVRPWAEGVVTWWAWLWAWLWRWVWLEDPRDQRAHSPHGQANLVCGAETPKHTGTLRAPTTGAEHYWG